MGKGIRDRIAVAGVGCTRFTEHYDQDQNDLLLAAVNEAVADAGIQRSDVEAIWAGIYYPWTGLAGTAAADALNMFGIPATRVENYCTSGMDAFRNACLAVASGVYDIVLACGVEKITDQGSRGLPQQREPHPVFPLASAPALFAMAATRSFAQWKWGKEDLAAVAVKNHENGNLHPKAHFHMKVDTDTVVRAPMIADPLGRLDCAAVSDGAAAIIVTRPEIAATLRHKDDYVLVKANALATTTAYPMYENGFDYLGFPATQKAAKLANCQDLGFCEPGTANRFVGDGHTRADGKLPVNASGGLKAFGHPIGATGCRMIYEVTRQLQGRADGAQVTDPVLGLAHNLGGPGAVASITILGRKD
jgi:acetyl-CoA C-acetyltransferase